MIRTVSGPQRLFIGVFLFLAAVALAVAPLPLALRSAGVLLSAYLGYAVAGMPLAYLIALLAPPLGLLAGDLDWMVMLPIVLSANLLAMLGLEFAWPWAALAVSPALSLLPQLFVVQMSRRDLFAVELPWEPATNAWLGLHALVAVGGVLIALLLDRRRRRGTDEDEPVPSGRA